MKITMDSGRYMARQRVQRQKRQAGFTLLEVLVALLLLSIGAMGMLGLQVSAAKSSVDANYQNTALQLASDLSAMMISNPRVSTLGSASDNPYLINKSTAASVGEGSGVSPLATAKAIATNDANQWYARGYAALPGFRAVVCFDTNPYDAQGIPKWGCAGGVGQALYIKIGWSLRQAGVAGGAGAMDRNVPGVVIPVGVCHPENKTAASTCAEA